MSHASRPRALRALSGGVLAALTLGLTAGVVPTASAATTYTATYTSTDGPITIPDAGDASPSPSVITVPADSGVTQVGDVSVTLKGLTHTAVDDLYVAIHSPSDTWIDLLCEQSVNDTYSPTAADVTFATEDQTPATCQDPAFDGDLMDLAGGNPAGAWELYVFDAYDGDAGSLAGWSLSFNQGVAPAITTEPQDVTAKAGEPATFTAAASGTPKPLPQWQVSTDGGTSWSDLLTGDNETTYVTAPTSLSDDGALYRAEFASPLGTTHSRAATLHVVTGPSAPLNVTAVQNDSYSTRISWSAPATGLGGLSGYRVTATDGTTTLTRNVSYGQTAVDLELKANTTYTVSVYAQSGATEGPAGTTSIRPRAWPTLSPSQTSVVAGTSIVLKGTGLPNETLTIEKFSDHGAAWNKILTVTTDAAGMFSLTTKADDTATYHTLTPSGLYSNNVYVKSASTTSMAAKRLATRKYTLSGTLLPKASGVAVKISYRKSTGAYGYLATVRTGSTGKWSYTKKYSISKTMVFKASIAATKSNVAGSKTLSVKVR